MRRNKPKKPSGGFDLDFDTEINFDGPDSGPDDSALDPVFAKYYTPEPADDAYAPEDEQFIQAAESEASQIMGDLQKADEHQRSILGANKKAVDSGIDCDYILVVTFVSEEQKLEFLKKSGWEKYGGARYLNGVKLAQDMGINLEPAYLATSSNPDKQLGERSRNYGSGRQRSKR
jgi:hypothetical protein